MHESCYNFTKKEHSTLKKKILAAQALAKVDGKNRRKTIIENITICLGNSV